MLAKIEFFEVYRVLWVLEFVDTDLEDHHLQIKYFTSIQAPECVSACPPSGWRPGAARCWPRAGPRAQPSAPDVRCDRLGSLSLQVTSLHGSS